jgi:hypothetical protein
MLRLDDSAATLAEGPLTETEAGPSAPTLREWERIPMLGQKERLRLTRIGAGMLRRPLISFISIGLAGWSSPVCA